jgi:hypothetical protein
VTARSLLRGLLAIAAALTVALVSAGCGRSDEEVFRKEKLNPAIQQADRQKAVISADLRTVKLGSKTDAAALRRQIGMLARIEEKIAALGPPGSVRGQFERYKLANAHLVAALRSFADGVEAANKQALSGLGERATEAVGQVQRSEETLREALAKKD